MIHYTFNVFYNYKYAAFSDQLCIIKLIMHNFPRYPSYLTYRDEGNYARLLIFHIFKLPNNTILAPEKLYYMYLSLLETRQSSLHCKFISHVEVDLVYE